MKQEFSAGGVVFKKEHGTIYILVAQHSGHHGWVFPKGLIGDHIEKETKEETALRETKEETGVVGRITRPLTQVDFYYEWQGEKRHKTVYYFLMEFVSGDTKNHDWEMENVQWLLMENVENRLTYESDKSVWQEAKEIIKDKFEYQSTQDNNRGEIAYRRSRKAGVADPERDRRI